MSYRTKSSTSCPIALVIDCFFYHLSRPHIQSCMKIFFPLTSFRNCKAYVRLIMCTSALKPPCLTCILTHTYVLWFLTRTNDWQITTHMSYNSYLQVITLKLCFHETDVDADAGVGGKKNRSNVFPLEPFPRGRRLRRHVFLESVSAMPCPALN